MSGRFPPYPALVQVGSYRHLRPVVCSSPAEEASVAGVSREVRRFTAPSSPPWGAINAALEALARGLALERAPVRVNTVSPGLIDTPLWHSMAEADRAGMFRQAAERLPACRVGQPEDIAAAILFVATNPFITVTVDGGGAIA